MEYSFSSKVPFKPEPETLNSAPCSDLPHIHGPEGPSGNFYPDEGTAGTWEAQNLYLGVILLSPTAQSALI